ncbi:hypothetical protein OJAV_G00235670 [Oryzias javanicus]|uniref:Uncharacterized protein n=1 Tax=Oryzias javanicus TaxID=123683 RepID=A0A437BZN3_ORYJA|nr:hypothetical protein OJAV_G00235670 [Oryzias javanicus]
MMDKLTVTAVTVCGFVLCISVRVGPLCVLWIFVCVCPFDFFQVWRWRAWLQLAWSHLKSTWRTSSPGEGSWAATSLHCSSVLFSTCFSLCAHCSLFGVLFWSHSVFGVCELV